jgi:hypothetical protein
MSEDKPTAPSQHALLKAILLNFLAQGQDALAHPGVPGIEAITLCRLEYVRSNSYHHVTTDQADDLFRSASTDDVQASPLPPNADLIAAAIDFRIAGCPDPGILEFRLPNTATLRPATHSQVILRWLAQSCLNASLALVTGALTIFLTLALAAAPCLSDNDGDADDADGYSERLILRHS